MTKKRKPHDGNGHPADPMERLAALVEKAASGKLTKGEQAELSMIAVSHLTGLMERTVVATEQQAHAAEQIRDLLAAIREETVSLGQHMAVAAGFSLGPAIAEARRRTEPPVTP